MTKKILWEIKCIAYDISNIMIPLVVMSQNNIVNIVLYLQHILWKYIVQQNVLSPQACCTVSLSPVLT